MKVALILSASFLAACLAGGASDAAGSNVPIPRTGTYLSVRLDSANVSGRGIPGAPQFKQLPDFNRLMGRRMAFIPIFLQFGRTLPLESLTTADRLEGIPLIELGCSDVDALAAGTNDRYLIDFARTIRSFGKPVFVRWYWEMNHRSRSSKHCNAYGNGRRFISAWRHIWRVLDNAGADNISLIWCPSAAGTGSAAYYPGDRHVDWIGGDSFLRGTVRKPDFDGVFDAWYAEWYPHGKPMMIGATGATAADQVKYFADIRVRLPTKYPRIKALNYFNAMGNNGNFTLRGEGLAAFKILANTPYFRQFAR